MVLGDLIGSACRFPFSLFPSIHRPSSRTAIFSLPAAAEKDGVELDLRGE